MTRTTMTLHNQFTYLSNGVKIPTIGLGTSRKGGYSHEAVVYALKTLGYRLIDTAARYNNECQLREAIKESGIPRETLFLTTKVWPASAGYNSTLAAFEHSCRNLGTQYLDLYLIHWPEVPSDIPDKRRCRAETWRALEDLYLQGRCRAIGVSNYLQSHLAELLSSCRIKPHVNQVEYHPYQNPEQLHRFCKEQRIQLQGYSPLAKATILDDAPIRDLAMKYGRSPAQICLRWVVQNGVVTIPKSTNLHRLDENTKVFDYELSADDMRLLDTVSCTPGGEGKEAAVGGRRVVFRELIQGKIDASYRSLQHPNASSSPASTGRCCGGGTSSAQPISDTHSPHRLLTTLP